MVARVIQGRLQKLAERVLPESQCGLRRWCGCIDMVFTVQQFTEKMIEHRVRLYPILIDLSEAYDLVPDEALWTALCKLVCMYIHTFVNPYLLSKKKIAQVTIYGWSQMFCMTLLEIETICRDRMT